MFINKKGLQTQHVEAIFNTPYYCIGTADVISLIEPVKEEPSPVQYREYGTYKEHSGVTVTVNAPMEDTIQHRLNGGRTYATDMDIFSELHLFKPETVALSIADIAEIVYAQGSLELTTIEDSIKIHKSLESYLHFVKDQMTVSPHYNPPPIDDLRKLEFLMNTIESMTKRELNKGYTETVEGRNTTTRVSASWLNRKPHVNSLELTSYHKESDDNSSLF